MNLTSAQYRETVKQPKKSKYRNRKTVVDGITFDSKLEAEYYAYLKLKERFGEVYEVEMQRPYSLVINGQLVTTYKADFVYYCDRSKRTRVIDVKGTLTDVFVLKRKLMRAIHGIDVEIVKKGDF